MEIFVGEFAGNEVSSFLAGLRLGNPERIHTSPPQLEARSWFGDYGDGERKLLDGYRPTRCAYPEVTLALFKSPDVIPIASGNYYCQCHLHQQLLIK
jgi:hypothetical protein